MKLLYDATDRRFAQRAVEEMRAAGIACYFAAERPVDCLSRETARDGVPDDASATYEERDPKDFEEGPEEAESGDDDQQSAPFGRGSVPTYPIYVDRDEDYQRASDILIRLGAAKDLMLEDSTVEAINYWSIAIAVLTVIVVVLYILQSRR